MMPPVPDHQRVPRAARVTTRTGDRGDTSLFGEGRVPKTDPRVSALGDLDEAQAALGVARAIADGDTVATILGLQRGLYLAMAEVATPADALARLGQRIDATAIEALERTSEALRAGVDITGRFVIPGEDPLSAALDVARTVIRRAERSVVALVSAGTVEGTDLLPWLNRLSDVVFVLSRKVEPAARPASGPEGPS